MNCQWSAHPGMFKLSVSGTFCEMSCIVSFSYCKLDHLSVWISTCPGIESHMSLS